MMGRGYQDEAAYEDQLLHRVYGAGGTYGTGSRRADNLSGEPDAQDYYDSLGEPGQDDPNSFPVGTPVAWIDQSTSCQYCQANAAASPLPYGMPFPDGSVEPPAHDHCDCYLLQVNPATYQAPMPKHRLPDETFGNVPGYWNPVITKGEPGKR